MIIIHPDIEYELIKQNQTRMVEEAELLSTLRSAGSPRPPLYRRLVDFSCRSLIWAGDLLTEWGLRLQRRYSPEVNLPAEDASCQV